MDELSFENIKCGNFPMEKEFLEFCVFVGDSLHVIFF